MAGLTASRAEATPDESGKDPRWLRLPAGLAEEPHESDDAGSPRPGSRVVAVDDRFVLASCRAKLERRPAARKKRAVVPEPPPAA